MTVRCAWCQSTIRRASLLRRCLNLLLGPPRVSHGICPACARDFEKAAA